MIVNLFAGPGGWEEGLGGHASDVVGVEWDPWACATQRAAGHNVVQADVATCDPQSREWPSVITGLIASPPCQLFSAAGKRQGVGAVDLLTSGIRDQLDGGDPRPDLRTAIADLIEPTVTIPDDGQGTFLFDTVPTSVRAEAERLAYQACLVVEPARWVHGRMPPWVALEQVPAVLPLWETMATGMRHMGYSVWCGIVNAADYGVPQTRRRAVLLASLDREVGRPAPTHSRDGDGLPRWVSMADALGWDGITTGHATMRGAGMKERHGDRPIPDETDPSQTITGKSRSWKLVEKQRRHNDIERDMHEPAMTIVSSADNGDYRFVNTGRAWKPGGTREDAQTVPTSAPAPAPALTAKSGGQWQWTHDRPATTLMGDARVFSPGGHIANDGRDNSKMIGRSENAITIEPWQALALQSFRIDYPVQGTRSQQFLQIGNAVPPLLARRLLEQVL